ncbi:MAG: 3-deoxy-manno-octulosonate cytidylyltransferase [Magnetococcales bacterium]|nr:3-deoxy-manno-octulosonate cytidylyltransferase [Magnetococcales bacterium]MBF0149964.1 3-deoxy-manno-octulosonate cytidylyltransferase [Magnetococcales bacterium]MBF0630380.1 3-deoxy-manno-octulosonate cytidylyltransferase [Magnetococcales bacterium]
MNKSVMAVIPARWQSQRFPGKPLALIAGIPMIVRVWQQASKAKTVHKIIVATEDERIAIVCKDHGIDCMMTSPNHLTGTDRLAEVASRVNADIFVNVQGDEPIIQPDAIDAVVTCLLKEQQRGIEVSTGYIEGATPEQEASPSSVHLVPTLDHCVLTFSRLPIPMSFREPFRRNVHVGLYAFTKPALLRFSTWSQGPVERAESIELLRFLEYGQRIACIPIPAGSIGVDHLEDIARVEAVLKKQPQ